jgi:hypothetical protein
MTDQPVKPSAAVKLNATRSSEYSQFYANNAQLRMSNWDILIEFGKIEDISPEAITVSVTTGVYMSIQHAKAFSAALAQNIASYESAFGTVALEPKQQ